MDILCRLLSHKAAMRGAWEELNLGLLKMLLEDTAIILAAGALVSTLLLLTDRNLLVGPEL